MKRIFFTTNRMTRINCHTDSTDRTDMMTKTYKYTALQQKQWMPHNAIALCNSTAWLLSLCKQACKMTNAMLYSCVFIHTDCIHQKIDFRYFCPFCGTIKYKQAGWGFMVFFFQIFFIFFIQHEVRCRKKTAFRVK